MTIKKNVLLEELDGKSVITVDVDLNNLVITHDNNICRIESYNGSGLYDVYDLEADDSFYLTRQEVKNDGGNLVKIDETLEARDNCEYNYCYRSRDFDEYISASNYDELDDEDKADYDRIVYNVIKAKEI